MHFFKHVFLTGIISLGSAFVHADISVENNSELPIKVSFHGDGCRLFDADRYNYAACDEKEIPVNATVLFTNMFKDFSGFSKKERAIVPRVIFSSFGFSYLCRVEFFYLTQLCDTQAAKNIPQCQSPAILKTEHAQDVEEISKSALLVLRGATLSLDTNYSLNILAEYGYFPQPYVACELSIIKPHSDLDCPK